MTINITMAVTLAGLYSIGFYLLMQRSLMRVILGIVLLGHAANLFLQVAGGPPGEPTFFGTAVLEAMVDPLPQALALTAIVITFALTTFLLALAYRSWALLGHDEVQDDVEDRRIAAAERAEREREEEAERAERVAGFEAPEAPETRPGHEDEEARIR